MFAVWRNQDPTSHAFNQSLMGQNSFGATPSVLIHADPY